jgi:glucosamine kinase
MAQIVIGIDGGGTYTRVIAADLSGRVLATAKSDAASPFKSVHAEENVRSAIIEVLSEAGHAPSDVVQLVAGIAGLDSPEDQEWAEKFTAVPGLDCPRIHVNDAVVAHAGALKSQPGIIAISGTGSIVFGVNEAGRHIRNYDFHHYANSSARALSYELIYRALAGDAQPEDGGLLADVLAFWQVKDLAELRQLGMEGFVADRFERTRLFGDMAPLITAAALKGIPLACAVCDWAAEALSTGIRLVGSCFTGEEVAVAPIGAAVRSDYIRHALKQALAKSTTHRYRIVEPAFSSEVGAVLMALERQNVSIGAAVLFALRAGQPKEEN